MSAQNTAGPVAALEISLRIGQHVRHRDYNGKRVTGVVRGLSVDTEDVLHAEIALDEAIVVPPMNADDHELRIYRQYVPAHEVVPFDQREELIAEMLEALIQCRAALVTAQSETEDATAQEVLARRIATASAAIAKATGSAS